MKTAVRRLVEPLAAQPPAAQAVTELSTVVTHPLDGWECCRDQVLLRCIEAQGERLTRGGIALPDGVAAQHEAASVRYEVVLAGPDAKSFVHGQQVILSQMAVGPVLIGGEELYLVSAERIQMARRVE